jgi:hypothetical protein
LEGLEGFLFRDLLEGFLLRDPRYRKMALTHKPKPVLNTGRKNPSSPSNPATQVASIRTLSMKLADVEVSSEPFIVYLEPETMRLER